MKILVTGGGGMVGRNLLADPRAADHEILAPPRARLDLRDAPATTRYIRENTPELIIHLAAVVGGIQANIDAPARFLADNLMMGLNLMAAARDAGTRSLVNLGSSCMYPRDIETPLTESLLFSGPLEPTNEGYAVAKLAAWKLAEAFGDEDRNLAYRTLIPPNLYGAFDTFDPVRSHLVAAAILKIDTALREGLREVEIWGDGEARREFMFAADLTDFIWTHLERLDELPMVMNVGVGEDRSVDEYYRSVAEVLGFRGAFTHDLDRPVGMGRKLLDVSVQTGLGWSAPTPLTAGVRIAADHMRGRL